MLNESTFQIVQVVFYAVVAIWAINDIGYKSGVKKIEKKIEHEVNRRVGPTEITELEQHKPESVEQLSDKQYVDRLIEQEFGKPTPTTKKIVRPAKKVTSGTNEIQPF